MTAISAEETNAPPPSSQLNKASELTRSSRSQTKCSDGDVTDRGDAGGILASEHMKKKLNAKWTQQTGRVPVYRSGAVEKLKAMESEYLVYDANHPFSVPVISLLGPNGELAWVGPKMDVYTEVGESVVGWRLGNGGTTVEWRTNVFVPKTKGVPVTRLLEQFDREVAGEQIFTGQGGYVQLPDELPQEFFWTQPLGSAARGDIEIGIKHASVKGADLQLTLEGVRGAIALVTLDMGSHTVKKATLNGKTLKLTTKP